MGILSLCEKHHFGLRNGLYWDAKWCFSAPEMGLIATRNGQYRNAGHIFSDYVTLVKKNRKFVSPFFTDNVCVMHERKHINISSYEPEACHAFAVMDYLLREREFIPNRSLQFSLYFCFILSIFSSVSCRHGGLYQEEINKNRTTKNKKTTESMSA